MHWTCQSQLTLLCGSLQAHWLLGVSPFVILPSLSRVWRPLLLILLRWSCPNGRNVIHWTSQCRLRPRRSVCRAQGSMRDFRAPSQPWPQISSFTADRWPYTRHWSRNKVGVFVKLPDLNLIHGAKEVSHSSSKQLYSVSFPLLLRSQWFAGF